MVELRPLRVFLCHAREDKPIVRELYHQLTNDGIDVWLDEEKLLPGQNWEVEIKKAVKQADVVIICLSNKSVQKEGYIQKEMRFVLGVSEEKPEDTIFVIPVRLDDCSVPEQIGSWQYLDYYPKSNRATAYQRLLKSLRIRSEKLGLAQVSNAKPTENDTEAAEQTRRFEGAMPKTSEVHRPTELRVMISLPDSEGLRKHLPENSEVFDEITQKDVKGNEIPLRFPVDAETNSLLDLNLFLSLKAPDFYVENPSLKILVPPGNDSGVFTFSMTPQKANPRSLIVLNLFCDESNSILVGSLTVTTQIKSWQERIANDTIKVVWQIAAFPLKLLISEKDIGILMHSHQPSIEMLVRGNDVETSLKTYDSPQKLLSETTSIIGEFVKVLDAVVDTGFWETYKLYNIKEQFIVVERQLQILEKQITTNNLLSSFENTLKVRSSIRVILLRLWNVRSHLYDVLILDGLRNGPRTVSFLNEYFDLKKELKYFTEELSVLSNHEQSDVDKHD